MNLLEITYEKLASEEADRRVKKRERRVARMGLKKNQPLRKIPSRQQTLDRYLSYTKLAPSGCMEWQRYRNESGYGMLKFGYEGLCHRIMWLLQKGPIPEGYLVCHTCDNPSCCNVDHLFIGTNLDNMRDASSKGRWKLRKQRRHKVTTEAYSEIRTIYGILRSFGFKSTPKSVMNYLSEKYGIAKNTITALGIGRQFDPRSYDPVA